MPAHTHVPAAQSAPGDQSLPADNVWASTNAFEEPAGDTSLVSMMYGAISFTGSSQPHENLMPYLAVSFIIATQGIFPSRD